MYKLQKEEEANLVKAVAREEPATPSPVRMLEAHTAAIQTLTDMVCVVLAAKRRADGTLSPSDRASKGQARSA